MKRFEFNLRRRSELKGNEVLLSGDGDVPEEFRKLVEQYYKSLSKTPEKGEAGQMKHSMRDTRLLAALAVAAARPCRATEARQAKVLVDQHPVRAVHDAERPPVILSQDRSTPTVAVNLWYHVGSKNEEAGRTGFAHLFEHVMFTGSGNVPYGLHDKFTSGVGGNNNGTTDNDRTLYYETVPSNYLETALWLEADRMGFLLDSLDIAKLNAQRDIVKNERRQRIDNQPYGRVGEILSAAMYPKGHPYSWSVIGSMEDLSAASEEDVKNFFRLYYAPNNAILTVVGDFDPAQAKTWIMKYFGGDPARQADHPPEDRAGDARPRRSGWSSKTRCRCRGCTCSGRRSASKHPDDVALERARPGPRRRPHRAADQGARL